MEPSSGRFSQGLGVALLVLPILGASAAFLFGLYGVIEGLVIGGWGTIVAIIIVMASSVLGGLASLGVVLLQSTRKTWAIAYLIILNVVEMWAVALFFQ